ncbi:efflux RND transporter periplasmic adaptor subunit [Segnochrobactraceae bacterium EtOH-i3]
MSSRSPGRTRPRRTLARLAAVAALPLLLAACQPEEEARPVVPRPVRAISVSEAPAGQTAVLTGHIEAEKEVAFGFRVGGRVLQRLVNVGDVVKPGQPLARLDPVNEQNNLRSAEAALVAAQSALTQATAAYGRQEHLLGRGFTTRAQYDLARQAMETSQAQLDDAKARLRQAEDLLDFTEIRADSAGRVTARGVEAGEVVQPGQMIVRIAREDGRDAVFDVPAQLFSQVPPDPVITIALTSDPRVTAEGHVREVSPQADPVTRTFQVKVGLIDPPAAMLLGSTVTGTVDLLSGGGMQIPASALTEADGQPAVWVVDPKTRTVALRPISVSRFDPSAVVVESGLVTGDVVVTAGVQALHPGQQVRLLGEAR